MATFGKMHTVEGDIVACDIFFIGGLAMCDILRQRESGGQI